MSRRICLIDDEFLVRDALAMGLRDDGHIVFVASHGAAGLEVLRQEAVEVVVTDMTMPGMSVGELIAAIRKDKPSLPIIAISGANSLDGRNLADMAQALGADAALPKPFRVSQLGELIEQLILDCKR